MRPPASMRYCFAPQHSPRCVQIERSPLYVQLRKLDLFASKAVPSALRVEAEMHCARAASIRVRPARTPTFTMKFTLLLLALPHQLRITIVLLHRVADKNPSHAFTRTPLRRKFGCIRSINESLHREEVVRRGNLHNQRLRPRPRVARLARHGTGSCLPNPPIQ